MRIDTEKYHFIADSKHMTDLQVMGQTGLSEETFKWIMKNKFIELDTLERIACVIGCSIQDIAVPDISMGDTKTGGQGENVIEWMRDSKVAMVTLTQRRYISKIKQYAENRTKECKILAENADGSICARVPISWVKVVPPAIQNITEEQRIKRAENLKRIRKARISYN